MATWYTKDANGLYGPYSLDDLVNLAKENRITPATMVRRRDSNSWVPASQLKGVFAEAASQKVPSPGAPSPLPQRPQLASREIASSKLNPSRKDSAVSPTLGAKTVVKSRATTVPSDSKSQHVIESTTKVVRSSPLGMPFFLWAIIASVGLFLVAQRSILPNAFVWLTEPAMPPIAEPPAGKKPLLADPATDCKALSAVRALLRRNLPTGKWKELLWWPTRTIVILTLGGQQPDGVDRRAKIMARMKFRTQNQSGAMEVYDFLFVVENDGVRVATDDVDFAHSILGKKMFDLGMKQITPSPERLVLDWLGGPRQWPPDE